SDNESCEGGCDRYELLVTNVGGAPTAEEDVTVTDELPAGVTTSELHQGDKEEFWECSQGAGQTSVTCVLPGAEVKFFQEHSFLPLAGKALAQLPALTLRLQVSPAVAPDTVGTGHVTVSSPGAGTADADQLTTLNPSAQPS